MYKKISILGNNELLSREQVYDSMFKSLKWSTRVKKEINSDFLKKNTKQKELIYHPLWLAKLLVIADRKPFPPKKTPMIAFIDSISGYRGLLSKVPNIVKVKPAMNSKIRKPMITDSDEIKKYIIDVQKSQINRSYVLKKPEYEIIDHFLVHLPLWKVTVDNSMLKQKFVINANTGESEGHMASLWNTNKMKIK